MAERRLVCRIDSADEEKKDDFCRIYRVEVEIFRECKEAERRVDELFKLGYRAFIVK